MRSHLVTYGLAPFIAMAWLHASAADVGGMLSPDPCPRPAPGSALAEPEDIRSEHGVLQLDLNLRNYQAKDGTIHYCYQTAAGAVAPTLRLNPGDWLILRLKNQLTAMESATVGTSMMNMPMPASPARSARSSASADPCTSGAMTATSTNLHFHGLTVPPVCHQDDVFKTSIQPTDPPFEYRFRIPLDEPPGLYWYHPHIHGFSARQVLGGASGALIVEGVERANPEVAGLPERVLIVRDQDLMNPAAAPSASDPATTMLIDRDGDAANTGTGFGQPAKDLSVNFVPVPYPDYPPAKVSIKPGERQLWRVLNASSVTYLNLALVFRREHRVRSQLLGVVALDGVALSANGSPEHSTEWRDGIVVPPGARVEFILIGPPADTAAELVTRFVDTGVGGENDPIRPLVSIEAAADAPEPRMRLPQSSAPLPAPTRPWLGSVAPVHVRKLYFSEEYQVPNDPNSPTKFFITVEGQKPAQFDPASTKPNITVHQGDVEDWIIENRSSEVHAFHIHQIHFQVVEWMGLAVNEPFVRDTINLPYYNSSMPSYPSVRLRMDFRDPNTIGTFVYHCHLLDHEDGGMMGLIQVLPARLATEQRTRKTTRQ